MNVYENIFSYYLHLKLNKNGNNLFSNFNFYLCMIIL